MFTTNSAIVMTMLALALRRVAPREWMSSAIVIFAIGLVAVGCQPTFELMMRGYDIGTPLLMAMLTFVIVCAMAARHAWIDLSTPPEGRRRRPAKPSRLAT